MNFAPDTFESIHRRKRLAAWLGTLKGPKQSTMQLRERAHMEYVIDELFPMMAAFVEDSAAAGRDKNYADLIKHHAA